MIVNIPFLTYQYMCNLSYKTIYILKITAFF